MMARPPEKTNARIIEAGLEIEAETGGPVRPSTIRDRINGGNVNRIREVWDGYCQERAQAAAAENDPDLILPRDLLELFEIDQTATLTQAKERFMAIYRAAKREASAAFAGERAAFEHDVAAAREALREADDQNDRLAAENLVLQRQAKEALAALADERRRLDRLEGQLAAAERAITLAQSAAADARGDQASVRAELAGMTERALRAEMAIEQITARARSAATRTPS